MMHCQYFFVILKQAGAVRISTACAPGNGRGVKAQGTHGENQRGKNRGGHDGACRAGECQEYIRFNKANGDYAWCEQPDGYYKLLDKIDRIKENGLQNDVRDLYIEKKNKNNDPNVNSRTIFAITVHEVFQKLTEMKQKKMCGD